MTVDAAMKENIKEIRNIENKYGLVLFRMGFSHLVDVGHRNLGDDEVAECVKQIMAQGEREKAESKISIMTPEFQCEILRCAAELAQLVFGRCSPTSRNIWRYLYDYGQADYNSY